MDFLKSAVASAIAKGPLAAYVVSDRVDIDSSIWILNNATKRESGSKCSIFTFDQSANKSRSPIAKNALKKFRTLHHPGVVKVLETFETETHLYIVTERLTPLTWYTKRSSLTDETLKWGLWATARTIKFFNQDASSIHGCLRAASIFVSESGEWKVGGFEILSSMNDDDAIIYNYAGLVPDINRVAPPEVSAGWDAIKRNPLSAPDAYGYGLLISEIFTTIPPTMVQSHKRLINPNPKVRLSVANFLDQGRRHGGFFRTSLIDVTEDIDKLGLKSESERTDFLSQLNETASDFPEAYLKHKVLPELLKSVEFGGGGEKVFSVVLQIGAKLSEDEYEAQLTPVLVRLFASPDRAIRVCLLDNLQLMIDHLPNKLVNDKIFPNIVTGFTDLAPIVREQTVKAVLVIIPKLSDRIINGELLKYLAKTANDEQPGIRTNTTICLGKIAKYLGSSTRTKVLVAAFTRSLRDPFVHARNAALLALGATYEMFSEDDCATKILPCICPSLLDKEKSIRDQANKTLDLYLHRIRKHAATLPDTQQQQQALGNGVANGPRAGTPGPDSSWTGWAISSFTNKFTAADAGQMQPKGAPANLTGAKPLAAPGVTTLKPSPSSSRASSPLANPGSRRPQPERTQSNTANKLAQSFTSPTAAAVSTSVPTPEPDAGSASFWDDWGRQDEANGDDTMNAWGDMGNEEDAFDHAARAMSGEALPPVSANSRHKQSNSGSKMSEVSYDDKGEPDFAGWLAAKKTGPQKPLPKGLGAKSGVATKGLPVSAAASRASKTSAPAPQAQSKPKPTEDDPDDWGDAWE